MNWVCDVTLDENEVYADLQKVIENVRGKTNFLRSIDRRRIVAQIFNTLVFYVTCLKHEGFKDDREWRAIYAPQRNASKFIKPSTEIINGIPQLIYSLPLDQNVYAALADLDFVALFDHLIIGPSQFPAVMQQAIETELKNYGIKDARKRILISDIPIRSKTI